MSAKIRAVSAKLPKMRDAQKLNSKQSSLASSRGDCTVLTSNNNFINRPKTAWKKSDLERIQSAGDSQSIEMERKQLEQDDAEIRRLELESQNRKRSLQELDMIRDEKLGLSYDSFTEEKATQEANLLNRALLAKHEQVN